MSLSQLGIIGRVAAASAQQAGISDYRVDLMPDDKRTAIHELGGQYGL
jgi:cation transport ATPase